MFSKSHTSLSGLRIPEVGQALERLQLVVPAPGAHWRPWCHENRADLLRVIKAVGYELAADLLGIRAHVLNGWLETIRPDPEGTWPLEDGI
jgi:hypothetical protein